MFSTMTMGNAHCGTVSVVAEICRSHLRCRLLLFLDLFCLPLLFSQTMAAIAVVPASTTTTADISRICLYPHTCLPLNPPPAATASAAAITGAELRLTCLRSHFNTDSKQKLKRPRIADRQQAPQQVLRQRPVFSCVHKRFCKRRISVGKGCSRNSVCITAGGG